MGVAGVAKKTYRKTMQPCNTDGGTIPGLIILVLFIACANGLLSKNKKTRRNALIVGMTVAFGGGLLYLVIGCN